MQPPMLKTKRISIENIQKKMRTDSEHVTTKKKKKNQPNTKVVSIKGNET